MTLTQNFKISYFEQKRSVLQSVTKCHKVSQSVTKCHKVSQSVTKFTKHSFRDGGGVCSRLCWYVQSAMLWWKPILVYSSGPTFELELELDLT